MKSSEQWERNYLAFLKKRERQETQLLQHILMSLFIGVLLLVASETFSMLQKLLFVGAILCFGVTVILVIIDVVAESREYRGRETFQKIQEKEKKSAPL